MYLISFTTLNSASLYFPHQIPLYTPNVLCKPADSPFPVPSLFHSLFRAKPQCVLSEGLSHF